MAPKDFKIKSYTISAAAVLNNSGLALHTQGLHFEALEKFQAALALEPNSPVIFNNRGVCYFSLDLFEDAIQSYKLATALEPRYVEAHNNLGNALIKLFQHEEALKCYNQALDLDPGYVEAYWNKALALLQLGRFSEGWVLHESRWAKSSFQPIVRHFPQPIWDGSFSIAGKTLLLHAEQGLGDTLQFVRYLELVLALGARVVLEVQAPLVLLLDGLFSVESLIKQGDPLPLFDCHCPLMSLPLAFQTTLSSIPITIPYIKSSPKKEHVWAEKLGSTSGLRVGLVWSGDPRHQNDKHRSIALAELMAALPLGLNYFSLQSEIRDSDRQALEDSERLVHFGPELKDFSDTAALCAQMDVVVCVDTSVAHLSGAMGKPTFLLLPYNPDWRWLLERTDSPWYPTMQLYRQAQLGSWQNALDSVGANLQLMASKL